jgi:putative membrane protein
MSATRRFNAASLLRLFVLGAWVLGLAWLLSGTRYANFIHINLWPLLVATLGLLGVFVAATFWRVERGGDTGRLTPAAWVQAGMLVLPLIYMAIGASDANLGTRAFAQRSAAGNAMAARDGAPAAFQRPSDGNVTLLDLLRHVELLAGREVTVEGMVYRGQELPAGHFVVFRFVMVCCAADAAPVGALVAWNDLAELPNEAWVRVRGAVSIEEIDGEIGPLITASEIERIERPQNPYLSP